MKAQVNIHKRFRYLFFSIAIFVAQSACAQMEKVEALKKKIQIEKNDTTLVKLYTALSSEYNGIDRNSSLFFARKALGLAEKIAYKQGQVMALNGLAVTMHEMGKYEEAEKKALKALAMARELKMEKEIATSLSTLGLAYNAMGKPDKSIEDLLEAMRYAEKINSNLQVARCCLNLSIVYGATGDSVNEVKYNLRAIDMLEKVDDPFALALSYNNMGVYFINRQNYARALYYLNKSLDISTRNNLTAVECLNNIGICYDYQGDLDKAEIFYTKGLEEARARGDKNGELGSVGNLAFIYQGKGDFKKAHEQFERALRLAKELNSVQFLASTYKFISDLYLIEKNYEKGMESYKKYVQIKDSVYNSTKSKQIAEMHEKYQTEKKDSEILILNKDKQQQRIITYSILGGLLLIVIFSGFLFRAFKQKQKANIEIQKQKEMIEEKNHEILDSITYAKRIQSAILPPKRLVKEYLPQSFVLYIPKDIVAGDFYWMEPIKISSGENELILFAAADCTGHGVPGAMVSVVCNNSLNRSVKEYKLTEPGAILDKTREIVIQEFEKSDEEVKDGMDISLCALNLKTKKLHWSGANNPLWVMKKEATEIEEIKANKQPIGKYAEAKPFTTHSVQLAEGDTVYIFTDGFQDQFGGEKGKKYKASKMKELFTSIRNEEMEQQRELINKAFENWRGSLEQVDDVCIIGVRV